MHTRRREGTEMATTESQPQQANVRTREVAKRVFAAELNEATYTFKTSQDERAPVYVALPTGERANRVFITGTVTDVENIGNESEYLRVRVVDPTGTFWVYAGQYQQDVRTRLKKIQPPEFVAIVGKPRTYRTDDGLINVSLVPEDVGVIDVDTRNAWVHETAQRTFERVASARETSPKVAALVREQYGHDGSYFMHIAAFALRDLVDADAAGNLAGDDESELSPKFDDDTLEKRLKQLDGGGADAENQKLSPAKMGRTLGDPSEAEADELAHKDDIDPYAE